MDTIDEFNKKLDKLRDNMEDEFLARVAAKTPVRTGALRDGWFWDRTGSATDPTFSNTQDYALYVENGTPKMPPTMMVATTLLELDDILKVSSKKAGL